MNCRIIAIDYFKRNARKLLKKYSSLKTELATLEKLLLEQPHTGTLITENTYKIRLAVKSKGKGKSGGLRVITHIVEVTIQVKGISEQDITIFLVAIYDKSKMANFPKHILRSYIEEIHASLDEEEKEDE